MKRLFLIIATTFVLLFAHVQGKTKEQEIEEQHKNDFISFDLNQDGVVDAQEVRTVFKDLSQEDLSAFFIAADANENGLIDYDEYVHASLTHGDKDLTLDDFQIN